MPNYVLFAREKCAIGLNAGWRCNGSERKRRRKRTDKAATNRKRCGKFFVKCEEKVVKKRRGESQNGKMGGRKERERGNMSGVEGEWEGNGMESNGHEMMRGAKCDKTKQPQTTETPKHHHITENRVKRSKRKSGEEK